MVFDASGTAKVCVIKFGAFVDCPLRLKRLIPYHQNVDWNRGTVCIAHDFIQIEHVIPGLVAVDEEDETLRGFDD